MFGFKKRRILVTAGHTEVPIDQVRSITNIFKGRTGTEIAIYLARKGHHVTLLTSNAHLVDHLLLPHLPRFVVKLLVFLHLLNIPEIAKYRTYDELMAEMSSRIKFGNFDTVIHSSAVSDYYVGKVFVPQDNGEMLEVPRDKKIGSDYPYIDYRNFPTKKIIDLIREPWGFKGTLVKFKLQVGISDKELMRIANKSLYTSNADLIVANCLEWADERAIISDGTVFGFNDGREQSGWEVKRKELPARLAQIMKLTWKYKDAAEKRIGDTHG